MPRLEKARRPVALLLAFLGWTTLAIQLYISITGAAAGGKSVLAAVVALTSFFTILTNILVAVCLTISCISPNPLRPKPSLMTAVALYIAIVGVIYALLLRNLWNPKGLQLLTDILLHDAMPVFFLIFWLLFVPKGTLRWWAPVLWLGYPLAYLGVTLLRGAATGIYPYPFIDIPVIGYERAAWNSVLLTLGFAGAGLLLVGLDRILGLIWGTISHEK